MFMYEHSLWLCPTSIDKRFTAASLSIEAEGGYEGLARARHQRLRAHGRSHGLGAAARALRLARRLRGEEVAGGAAASVDVGHAGALGLAEGPLPGEPRAAEGPGADGGQRAHILPLLLRAGEGDDVTGAGPGAGVGVRGGLQHADRHALLHRQEHVLRGAAAAVHELLAPPDLLVEGEPGDPITAQYLLHVTTNHSAVLLPGEHAAAPAGRGHGGLAAHRGPRRLEPRGDGGAARGLALRHAGEPVGVAAAAAVDLGHTLPGLEGDDTLGRLAGPGLEREVARPGGGEAGARGGEDREQRGADCPHVGDTLSYSELL